MRRHASNETILVFKTKLAALYHLIVTKLDQMTMRMLWLVTWLTLMTGVTARDSCEDFEDYLCGDVCIGYSAKCHCGEERLEGFLQDVDYYCCLPRAEHRQQCYRDQEGDAHCPDGEK